MRLLMCRPDHYGVFYEINPWMSRARPADQVTALREWEGLRRILSGEVGAEVLLVEQPEGLPDMVFTANAGLVRGDTAILSRFRHPERQGEEAPYGRWFEGQGFRVVRLDPERRFEGEGDALMVGDTLFAGYFWRSDVHAHREVGELLGLRVLSLQLADPYFYHLDTCFCPLDAETAAWYPPAFDEYAQRVIRTNIPRLLNVAEEEARRFACNAVVLGEHVVLNDGAPRLEAQLREHGFTTHPTPLDEFIKAGGSAKCLTLYLDNPTTGS